MKISNKDTLKKLAKYGILETESVNGNVIISDGSDIIIDDNGEKQRVITENVTVEELNLAIQVKQLSTIKSIKGMVVFITVVIALYLIVAILPVLLA